MSALVSVENLTKHFERRSGLFGKAESVRAVDGVSFEIEDGETLGLVGESGSGKSTLGRAILRLIEPSSGRVVVDGVEVNSLAPEPLRKFRRHAQIIFQDPYASLNPRMRVSEILREPLIIHGLGGSSEGQKRRVRELLDLVGLRPELEHRYPHEFSGGQRQRIGIARALAVEPRFIVADEPLSALDVSIQAQIVNLLLDLKKDRKLTFLFISHDLKIVEHLCHRVAVLYLGKIVELAPAIELYSTPRHPYTQALLSAVPRVDPSKRRDRIVLQGDPPSPAHPPSGCAFHPRCPLYAAKGKPEICRAALPELKIVAPSKSHRAACHFAD